MNLPDGRPLVVHENVLAEETGGRLVLWCRGSTEDGVVEWERVGTTAGATVETELGISSIAASSFRARQRLRGIIGRIIHGLVRSRSDRSWRLPGGGSAAPYGGRRPDLRLVWAEDASMPLEASIIAARWPGDREIRPLGPGLFLVSGPGAEWAGGKAMTIRADEQAQESELAITVRALEAAIRAGDRRRIVTASTDLGLVLLHIGDPHRSAKILSEALVEADRIGDASLSADVANNLAHTELYLGQARAAFDRLGPILNYAQAAGDVACEKLALDWMARALLELGDRDGGLACLRAAAVLAARLSDFRHEADLLWLLAIHLADMGCRDDAVAAAGTAVERLRHLGHPALEWYASHLERYRSGLARMAFDARTPQGPQIGGAVDVRAERPQPDGGIASGAAGPLRMAITATRSMAAFVASGFKTTSPQTHRGRLTICITCEHHTGTRCRVCGCITAAKARLQHEHCPLGRW